jgi:hypothetical protein
MTQDEIQTAILQVCKVSGNDSDFNVLGFYVLCDRLVELGAAAERERMYGKDIDTLLFEEHRLGFEKGSRSEREACYTIAKFNQSNHLEHLTADQIKARGETK